MLFSSYCLLESLSIPDFNHVHLVVKLIHPASQIIQFSVHCCYYRLEVKSFICFLQTQLDSVSCWESLEEEEKSDC